MARAKTCKACKTKFTPRNSLQKACSIPCSLEIVKADNDKQEKRALREKSKTDFKELRARKERLKTRRDHMRECQQEFNAFIRARDHGKPCISCGRNDGQVMAQAIGGSWDCGHYRSVGSCPELRFEELNAHRQCKQCNRDYGGRIVDYRLGLLQRIGQEKVEWLEGPHEPKRYTIDELKELKEKYQKLARGMKKKNS